tara:strand:- start:33 stop:1853 length:1821 start_codon:yes stop_codon:yes gene_type:complete
MGETKVNNNMIQDGAIDSSKLAPNSISSANITDSSLVNADISPSAAISISKISTPGSATDFLKGDGSFGAVDTSAIETNTFNIGVLGFKMAVNDGLTVYNLIDGVVDEFHDETGVDTAENSNATYDSTSDFYTNDGLSPVPATTNIQAFWNNTGTDETTHGTTSPGAGVEANAESAPFTYTAPPSAVAVNLLVVGGGGAGAGSLTPSGVGGGGGGGSGGLVYIENFPVTGGATYPISVGAGGSTYYDEAEQGGDSVFTSPTPTPFGTSITAEGGGGGGGYPGDTPGFQGGSGGGGGFYNGNPISPGLNPYGEGTQADNFPIPGITPAGANAVDQSPNVNLQGSYGNDGAAPRFGPPSPGPNYRFGSGGGAGEQASASPTAGQFSEAGDGLLYTIADGSTSIAYAGGGGGGIGGPNTPTETATGGGGRGGSGTTPGEQADAYATNPLLNGTNPPQFGPQIAALSFGGGGGGGGNNNSAGGRPLGEVGGSGVIYVAVSQTGSLQNSMTLISDTFTANATPSKARIVLFAELPDGTSDFSVSATRDNTTFNAITLTDEGFQAGSSGIKIFTGSTPLTGSASPQVQLRWKIVGSSLTGNNKIHGVALQWA